MNYQVMVDGVVRDATEEEILEIESRNAPKPVPPVFVTNGQAKLALLDAGLLDTVNQAIAGIPDEGARARAQIEWEYRPTVDRDSSLVASMAQALGLTDEQLDNLFIRAATL